MSLTPNQMKKMKNYQQQSGEMPQFLQDEMNKTDNSLGQQFDDSNSNLKFGFNSGSRQTGSNPISPEQDNQINNPGSKFNQNIDHLQFNQGFVQKNNHLDKLMRNNNFANSSGDNPSDMDEFLDLSNVHQITDLNKLQFRKQSGTNSDQNNRNDESQEIDVNELQFQLNEGDDISQMEMIMQEKMNIQMNLAQKQLYQHMEMANNQTPVDDSELNDLNSQIEALQRTSDLQRGLDDGGGNKSLQRGLNKKGGNVNFQDVIIDTPPKTTSFNFNDSDGTLGDSIKMQFLADDEEFDYEKQKKILLAEQRRKQESQHQQIQQELRELLAQSSSEQLLIINQENDKIESFDQVAEQEEMNAVSPLDNADEEIYLQEQSFSNNGLQQQQPNNNRQFQFQNNQALLEDEIRSPPNVDSNINSKQEAQVSKNLQRYEMVPEQTNFMQKGRFSMSPKSNSNYGSEHLMGLSAQSGSGGMQAPERLMPERLAPPMVMPNQIQAPAMTQPQEHPPQIPVPVLPKPSSAAPPTSIPVNSSKPIAEKPKNEIEDLSKPKEKKKGKDIDKQAVDAAGEGEENDSFHRLYNKEIKVNQDEIPLLLLELTDIAYKFIVKDQYEKAYVLLQKTESVLEVVNLEHSKRDKYFAYITYHNMAMCFQKLGMLEECVIYLKETIQVIEKSNFFKDISISQRMKQMHMQIQLRLQLCAILSQTQKHTEAMEHAKISVRVSHQVLRDMYDLCVFYSNKIKFKDDFASLSLLLMDDFDSNNGSTDKLNQGSKDKETKPQKHTKSELQGMKIQKEFIKENSPVRDIPYNIMEESISMIERTALKLLPIMKELGNRLAGANGKKGLQAFHNVAAVANEKDRADLTDKNIEAATNKQKVLHDIQKKKDMGQKGLILSDEEDENKIDIKDLDVEVKGDPQEGALKSAISSTIEKTKQEEQIDMRTVLGFLNQNEWILNLNIGNIMQIHPIRMKDFMNSYRNEHQLSRESFLEKLQLLIVSYFCVSTEMRFIIQSRNGFMKPETKKEKELEQEYWHVKALDISCAFLPSECPLFNHILLSYQKHHDPSNQPINEDEEQDDVIRVLRPLKGIENSKHQPIIRELSNVYVDVAEIPLSPLSKCFDKRLLPKKTKMYSINIQTDPIQEPTPPLMKSQSISVQEDLKSSSKLDSKVDLQKEKTIESIKKFDIKYNEDSSKESFDVNNAYMDLNSARYQEKLISKIIGDPKLGDKQMFLTKLISKFSSEEPDKQFQNTTIQTQTYDNKNVYTNTNGSADMGGNSNPAMGTINNKRHPRTITKYDQMYSNDSLQVDPQQQKNQTDSIYGDLDGRNLRPRTGGSTQNKASKKNPRDKNHNFQSFGSQKMSTNTKTIHNVRSQQQSLYGDVNSSNDVTTIGGGVAKHHIVSQRLQPSHNVFNEDRSSIMTHVTQHLMPKGSVQVTMTNTNNKYGMNLGHKKNQSTSNDLLNKNYKAKGGTIDPSLSKNFNSSVNTNLTNNQFINSKKKQMVDIRQGKSKQLLQNQERRRQNMGQKITDQIEKQYSNINLTNQKLAVQKHKTGKFASQNEYIKQQRSTSNEKKHRTIGKDRSSSSRKRMELFQEEKRNILNNTKAFKKKKQKVANQTSKQFKIPNATFIENNDDVMSDSSREESIENPDVHPQPNSESQISENNMNHKSSPERFLRMTDIQNTNDQSVVHQQSQSDAAQSQHNQKSTKIQGDKRVDHDKTQKVMRPQSAITNYTSTGQSGVKSKYLGKQRRSVVNQITNSQQKGLNKNQLANVQKQQNYLTNLNKIKQSKVIGDKQGRKKQKVISRKKYGSDRSSNSPPLDHGYCIAQQPFSIFDSNNAHSVSHFSKTPSLQQNQQSIQNLINQQSDPKIITNNAQQFLKNQKALQNMYFDQKGRLSTHSSQTLTIDKNRTKKKGGGNVHALLNNQIQNQSENILAKLQNLLVNNKEDDRKSSNDRIQHRIEKRGKQLNITKNASSKNYNISNPRKSANSIGSLGNSNQRHSRYSQNYSRSKSREPRSKSGSKKSSKSRQHGSQKQSQPRSKTQSNERSGPRQLQQTQTADSKIRGANRTLKKGAHDNLSKFANANNSVVIPSSKNHTINDSSKLMAEQIFKHNISQQMNLQNSMEMNKFINSGNDLQEVSDFVNHQNSSQQQYQKKRQGMRSSALRTRPKSSMLENHRDQLPQNKSLKRKQAMKKTTSKGGHNSSIENLQRQVLENQMILLNNLHAQNQQSQKTSKRMTSKHNHNNSIGQMNNINDQQRNSQSTNPLNPAKSILTSSGTSGTKKKGFMKKQFSNINTTTNALGQPRNQNQGNIKSYNTSQLLNHLQSNMQNLHKSDSQFKMTQQNLSSNLRNFTNMTTGQGVGALSTSSTSHNFVSGKSMKNRKMNVKRRTSIQNQGQDQNVNHTNQQLQNQSQFVNFEQIQKQLENGMTLGGQDLMHKTASQQLMNSDQFNQNFTGPSQSNQKQFMQIQMNNSNDGNQYGSETLEDGQSSGQIVGFIRHKNLMPKTTGSQAHLLALTEDQNILQKQQYNSLNLTGKTTNSLNKHNLKKSKNQQLNH